MVSTKDNEDRGGKQEKYSLITANVDGASTRTV